MKEYINIFQKIFSIIAILLLSSAKMALSQNTFRYKFCQDLEKLPNWQINIDAGGWAAAFYGNIHQVPSDSGYVYFTTAIYNPVTQTPPFDRKDCFSATKLDKYGNLKWQKAYKENDFIRNFKNVADGTPTNDSGFIMAGSRFGAGSTNSNHEENTLIQKTDKNGNVTWAKTYDVGSTSSTALKIKQMPDGGYIILGRTKDENYGWQSLVSYDIYLLRIDKNGNKVWSYRYNAGDFGEETPNSIDLTTDSGFIIGGYSYEGTGNQVDKNRNLFPKTRFKGQKGLLMKVSANGQTVEWARRYGEIFNLQACSYCTDFGPVDTHFFADTKQTHDGGFISVGYSSYAYPKGENSINRGAWVVKTNAEGIVEWQKNYVGIFELGGITLLNDGYLLLNRGFSTTASTNEYNAQIIKINHAGEVQWSKLYDQKIYGLTKAVDGGFVLTGDNVITKTNQLGEFDEGCFYNSTVLSIDGIAEDTAYVLKSTSVNLSPATLALTETTVLGTQLCPVICNINETMIPPSVGLTIGICANTDATMLLSGGRYTHYKINFGDPVSGAANELNGSPTNETAGFVAHNYAAAGTYTLSLVAYNADYSQSTDTVFQKVTVIPELKYKILTPEIHICKSDTITLAVQFYNWGANWGIQTGWEPPYPTFINGNPTQTLKDSVYNISGRAIADASTKYYVMYYQTTGSLGCLHTDTIKVYAGDIEAAITGNTKICKGGKTQLTASAAGANKYLWNTGATTASITVNPAINTTYWAEVKTKDGCKDTAYTYVQIVNSFTVQAFADRNSVCIGDTVTLSASSVNAASYVWNNSKTGNSVKVITSSGLNNYSVMGNSGSCSASATVQVLASSVPVITISGTQATYCAQPYLLKASGGENYFWANSAENNSEYLFRPGALESGYINLRVANGGCYKDSLMEYNSNNALIDLMLEMNAKECRVCSGASVTLRNSYASVFKGTSKTNLTYQWSTGQTTAGANDSIKMIVTKDTIVSAIVTNEYGCKAKDSVVVYVSPHFDIKKQITAAPSCNNTPTTLMIIGAPLHFIWSTGSTNDTIVVSPLNDQMYYITATENGCSKTDSIWVKAKANLPKASITGDSLLCKNAIGNYLAKGNSTPIGYKWLTGNAADTNATIDIPVPNNLTLSAYVTFLGGCGDTAKHNITVIDPKITITGDTVICVGGTTSLKASGAYYYRWSNGSTTNKISITASVDTKLSLIATTGSCVDTLDVTVKTNEIINTSLFVDTDSICDGSGLTLIANGGDNYLWSNGEKGDMIGISPASTTTYSVAITTLDNCYDTQRITVTVNPLTTLSLTGQSSICFGKSVVLSASGNSYYLWSTGDSSNSITVTPISDSTFFVFVPNTVCTDTAKQAISVIKGVIINAGADVTVIQGTEVDLIPTGGSTYNWSTIDGFICNNCTNISVSPTKTTTYYLTDPSTLCSEDSVTIYVLNCSELIIPNAFSPNGDDNNDVLYLQNDCIKDLTFEIFDRWGNKVFTSNTVTNGWDGRYKGKELNADVFVYSIKAITFGEEVITKKGNVTLIR